jgi:heme-degrading monooxygenase HmoA
VIERHIAFTVRQEAAADFERFFAQQYLPAASRSPGFVRLDLLRSTADPTNYEMSFRWQDAEAAAGWRTSPVHEGLQPELKSLAGMGAILIYDVVA